MTMQRPADFPGGPLRDIRRFDSVSAMLDNSASRWGKQIFMKEINDDGTNRQQVSFIEMNQMAESLARELLNLQRTPVVAIAGRNGIEWAIVFLATLKAGGIVVPIDKELSASEISGIIHYSGTNIFFFDGSFQEAVNDHLKKNNPVSQHQYVMNCEGKAIFPTWLDAVSRGRSLTTPLPENKGADRAAVISYTSGTMGHARGVILSQGNILSDLQMMLSSVYIRSDEVFLSVLPFHHMYECVCGFLCPLQHGCTVVISRGLRYIVEDLSNNGVTMMLGVPLLWEGMYKRILKQINSLKGGSFKFALGKAVCSTGELLGMKSIRKKVFSRVHSKLGGNMRTLISGGAAIDQETVTGFKKLGIRMIQGYGLTECSPIVAVNRYDVNEPGTVGPPLPGIELKIDNPDGEGAGEIVVRGPNVMKGYYNDPDATALVLSPDGWFKTGDYGIYKDGVLRVTGRKKNVIIAKNGKNVYPEELEHMLNRSQYIAESLVFGRKSEIKGEEIWTIIYPDNEALIELAENRNSKLTEEFGLEVIRKEVASINSSTVSFKRISNYLVRDSEFPKTTTRKIRRLQVMKESGLTTDMIYTV